MRIRKRYIVLILLIALCLYWLIHDDTPPAIAPGKLSVEDAVTLKEYPLGEYVLRLSMGDDGAALKIFAAGNPEKMLWESLPGKSFLQCGFGKATVKESRGLFTVKDQRAKIWTDQRITNISANDSSIIIEGNFGVDDALTYTMSWSIAPEAHLRFQISISDPTVNRIYLTYHSSAEESFYGFGEQFTYFDLKGRRVPIIVSEQGIGRGAQPITAGADLTAGAGGDWHTSYVGVPHYLTSEMRSLFLENYEYSIFDLRENDQVQVEVFANQMVGRVLSGNSPLDLIESYTRYAGRMRQLPDWIQKGAVIGMQGGTARVKEVYQALQKYDVPVAAFWLQDWVGQRKTSFGKQLWWNWEVDEDRYPEWATLVDTLEKDGIAMMTYINPFLVTVEDKANAKRDLFNEAAEKGYLIRDEHDQPYMILNTDFSAGLVDLSNPQARDWIRTVIQEQLIASGAKGWMADFGEALPADAQLFSGEDAFVAHNRYPEDWAEINREAIEALGDSLSNEYVFFSRSGYMRSPRYTTLFWLGDQLVSWDQYDGIKTAVTGMLSSGISGYSLNHSDIGGYTTITNPLKDYHRSKELFMRWTELSAFTPVFRTHEGNQPDNNHQFHSDEETFRHFSRFAKIYAALADYRRQLGQEAAEKGWPLVRHPFLHYPHDPEVRKINHEQFMLGPDLMIAPVLDPGVEEVQVYLPAGEWTHLWSQETWSVDRSGKWLTVPAPVGELGVFVRGDFMFTSDLLPFIPEVVF